MQIGVDPNTFARIRDSISTHKVLLAYRCATQIDTPCDAVLVDGWRRTVSVRILHCAPYGTEQYDNVEYAANYFSSDNHDPIWVLAIMIA